MRHNWLRWRQHPLIAFGGCRQLPSTMLGHGVVQVMRDSRSFRIRKTHYFSISSTI
jgi:hypothetical protein